MGVGWSEGVNKCIQGLLGNVAFYPYLHPHHPPPPLILPEGRGRFGQKIKTMFRLVTRLAYARFGQVDDQVGQGQGQELDNMYMYMPPYQ